MVLFVIAVCYDLCTTFRTILVPVRFVHKKPIHTQLLKGDDVILSLLCLQLPESSFQLLAGAFHLLDGELLTAHEFQLLDAVRDFLNLLLQQTLLTFLGHGDFLELTVPDNDRVIIPGSDAGAEPPAVVLLEILLCRDEDFGRGIQPQEFRRPLLCKMIGHDEHAFAA